MTGKTINLILLGVLVGVLLGGMLGAVIPDAMLATALIGKLYFNALALVAIILVLVGFPLALARFGDIRRFNGTTAGSFVITISSAVVLIAVGVVLVRLVAAQAIAPHGFSAALFGDFLRVQASASGDYLGLLLPETLLRAVLTGSYLGWVLFALIIGLALPEVGTRGRTLQMWLDDLTRAMLRITELLLVLAPIALIFVTGVIVASGNGSFSDIFSTLWYPIVLVIAVMLFAAVVLPLAIKWWHKVPENKGQRDDSGRSRDRQPMSGRPGQRPMGQDRGGRGRDQRFDRNRDRNDRPRGDRDDRGDRPRRDGRRDNQRSDGPREDSPFAVSKSAQVFDPEAPAQPVQLPELAEEVTSDVTEERSQGDNQRRERTDRPDRGPRDRRDRDRRGGGRDRQGRPGRDRGRGPRRFERTEQGESTPSTEAPVEAMDSDVPSDLSRVFEPVGDGSFNDDSRTPVSRPSYEPERSEASHDDDRSEEPEQTYGRGRHAHRSERTESSAPTADQPGQNGESHGSQPTPIDHFDTDGMAFGRGNRRKMKR